MQSPAETNNGKLMIEFAITKVGHIAEISVPHRAALRHRICFHPLPTGVYGDVISRYVSAFTTAPAFHQVNELDV
jgi:hypothetical protein